MFEHPTKIKQLLNFALISLFLIYAGELFSQNDSINNDKIEHPVDEPVIVVTPDSLTVIEYIANDSLDVRLHAENLPKSVIIKQPFVPSPQKALLYSVIFPGLGQIYNKKYWKLPLVYGGMMGVVYAVTWNGNLFNDYQKAYKDIVLDPEGTTSWHNFVFNPQQTLNNPTLLQQETNRLKRRRNYFRRNRDLAIIVGVGLYALCIIDAYVDASLYGFTVSPDLSMSVSPVVWGSPDISGKPIVGMQMNITF